MVDTRLREHWLHKIEFIELSDSAWTLLTRCLMWSNSQGTDGEIPPKALTILHAEPEFLTAELVASGLFEQTKLNFRLRGDWENDWGQTRAADFQARRENARIRQQRKRESESENNVTRDVPRDVGEERQGEEMRGEEMRGEACEQCGQLGENLDFFQGAKLCISCISRVSPI